MDTAIIIISIFVAIFVTIAMTLDATYIRTLREKIAQLEKEQENATEIYAKGAEIDRDRCEELRLSESHQKWFRCEARVRAYIMSSPERMQQLRNAGHLDRQYWVVQEGTKILFSCEEEEMGNELVNWWENMNKNNFNV